jgi:hypothetical protein
MTYVYPGFYDCRYVTVSCCKLPYVSLVSVITQSTNIGRIVVGA